MSRKHFSEEQIIYALKQAENGKPVRDVCRELGMSEQSFYTWKRKYGGMGISELRKLRQLRDENRQLKRIVAELILDKHILQEVCQRRLQMRQIRQLECDTTVAALSVHAPSPPFGPSCLPGPGSPVAFPPAT